jgi:hypothetical protein
VQTAAAALDALYKKVTGLKGFKSKTIWTMARSVLSCFRAFVLSK